MWLVVRHGLSPDWGWCGGYGGWLDTRAGCLITACDRHQPTGRDTVGNPTARHTQSTVIHPNATARTVLRVEQRKPAKRSTTVRLASTGRQRVAERAARADVDFSHMLRRMLAYADQHMPEGWVPARDQDRPT